MLTRIHVNKFRIRSGHAAIGIERTGRRKIYRRKWNLGGGWVIMQPGRALSCGAKVWIEKREAR